jgi:heme-degrading monooxygenase HmoA
VLVVTRFRVPEDAGADFLARAQDALAAFAAAPGYRSGRVGRSTDDPTLWVLSMDFEGTGAYRRALSSYEVKVRAVPVMMEALDEPSAYEVLAAVGAEGAAEETNGGVRRTRRAADAGTVAVGEASGPDVPTGLGPAGER